MMLGDVVDDDESARMEIVVTSTVLLILLPTLAIAALEIERATFIFVMMYSVDGCYEKKRRSLSFKFRSALRNLMPTNFG